MSGFRVNDVWAPVPNALVEVASTTMIGQFVHSFVGPGPQAPIYIRPGQLSQQDLANRDGSAWVLYTRSVMSYSIAWDQVIDSVAGATLIVELGGIEFGGVGTPQTRDTLVFHLVGQDSYVSHNSGIELPSLFARFKILTANDAAGLDCSVAGTIIVRAL